MNLQYRHWGVFSLLPFIPIQFLKASTQSLKGFLEQILCYANILSNLIGCIKFSNNQNA